METEITMDVLCKASVEIEKLLVSYQEKINKTFCDELTVSINMPIKIDIGDGNIIVKTGINFIESRVKDESLITVNPNQRQLFPAITEVKNAI